MSTICGTCLKWEENKMKKIVALLLVLCMALSMCACGASKEAASEEKVIENY